MARPRTILAMAIILLALALQNFSAALVGAPAFDRIARQEGVTGEWRVFVGPAMYDRAEYLFQLGYGYVFADLLVSEATEGRDETADFETALRRAETASALLAESVSLDPGNAKAWETLAWARVMSGETEAAAAALRVSWTLAPYNAELSVGRLELLDLLADPFSGFSVAETDRSAGAADIATAAEYRQRELAMLLEEVPYIRDLAAELLSDPAR